MSSNKIESKYLQYLPGIYQAEEDSFLGMFLKAFENTLSEYKRIKIEDTAGLASRLLDIQNPLSQYIVEQFSNEARRFLDEYKVTALPSEALQKALADELNRMLLGEPIYEEKRFAGIILTAGTKELLDQMLKGTITGEELIHLNMLLLEEAFPNKITKEFPYEIIKRRGFEEVLNQIQNYFDPNRTPLDFLPWLAGWMALIPKEETEWNENNARKKRDLIARIIPLYQKRGTLEGLRKFIRIYVGEDVKISINELLDPFQVGMTSTVGMNTVIDEGCPYYFQVYMELPTPNRNLLEKKRRAIEDIINQEKPAHTYYDLMTAAPTMQIAVYSKVGVDTLLGGMIKG